MARILFVHNLQSPFVQTDLEMLATRHQVTPFFVPGRAVPVRWLLRAVKVHDLVFCWFASWHSLFPALLARALDRPTIVVTGGHDTANLPEIDYGHQRGGLRKVVSRTILRSATRLLVLSEYSRKELLEIDGVSARRVSLLYLGLRVPDVPAPEDVHKEEILLTVGGVDRLTLWRKGLEPFVRSARLLPDHEFYVVGKWRDRSIEHLRRIASSNVHFTGFMDDLSLSQLRLRAKVYAQLSLHEGFGLAVAEAMLAYCIPVVTQAGALPEVVGDCGIYTESNDPANVTEAMREAMDAPLDLSVRARERIINLFPYDNRRAALLAHVDQTLTDS